MSVLDDYGSERWRWSRERESDYWERKRQAYFRGALNLGYPGPRALVRIINLEVPAFPSENSDAQTL